MMNEEEFNEWWIGFTLYNGWARMVVPRWIAYRLVCEGYSLKEKELRAEKDANQILI